MATATLSPHISVIPSFPTPDTYNPGAGVVKAPPATTPTPTPTPSTTIASPPPAINSTPALHAAFNYYLAPADGSPPPPNYVDKPETYDRPVDTLVLPVRDIRGDEDKYTLDTTGFQVIKHASAERDFLDEEQIKKVYYPEVEAILKET